MSIVFYIAAFVAIVSTLMVVTRRNAVHALLYLVVSLLAVALVFFVLGAPFAAALEVIVYAGAIVVLFVFVVILLNQAPGTLAQESQWLSPAAWIGPAVLALILLAELIYVLAGGEITQTAAGAMIPPEAVGIALYGPYVLGVELASLLLLAGLVGAYHVGRRTPPAVKAAAIAREEAKVP